MSNILETYYQGITQKIRAEVDFINSIFKHQGVKGNGNEIILRDLLKKLIPKRYGIGTGIIIDRKGNQSKQIDIVIYDQILYPSILALSSVHLFPVDMVYAVIEIKTTLTSEESKQAIENIASVRSLEIIPQPFSIGSSSTQGFNITSYEPSPPMGVVFAYNSSALNFKTFKTWFVPDKTNDFTKYPSLIGCLDQGLIFNDVISNQPSKGYAIAFHYGNGKSATINKKTNLKEFIHEGVIYPIKIVHGKRTLIDQSRALLLFIIYLSELLETKQINPSIKFSEHYFDKFTTFRIDV